MKHGGYKINGKTVTRRQFLRRKKRGVPACPKTYGEGNPLQSEALGCMKSQVPEMRRVLKKRGIRGVRVLDNGAVELTSRGGRRELMKLRGLHDNDGGLGDG